MSKDDVRIVEHAVNSAMCGGWCQEQALRSLEQLARTAGLADAAVPIIQGLMEIAETAMPDSYFEGDSRTAAARKFLSEVTGV